MATGTIRNGRRNYVLKINRITCARWGTLYSAFQVERLYAECRAWIDFDEFHVFTDQKDELHPNIITHEIPKTEAYRSWWSKMLQFKTFTQGTTLSLDIDMHIRDSVEFKFSRDYLLMQLDPLAQYMPHKNVKYVNSSVITYEGDFSWVHDKYFSEWATNHKKYRGDQEFMWGEYEESIRYHPPVFESYKWESRERGYAIKPLVNFHGHDMKGIVG